MPRFVFDGETFELIKSRFTFGEAAALERNTGLSMGQLLTADDHPELQTAAVMQAFLWVSIKRKRPTFLFEELEDVGMDDGIEWIEEPEPEEAPQAAQDAAVGPTSPALGQEPRVELAVSTTSV